MASNYIQGGFAGFQCAQYAYAGGPFTDAVAKARESSVTAKMFLYAIMPYRSDPEKFIRQLIYTKDLVNSEPFRMPGGYLADNFEVEFVGNNVTIHEVQCATTMRELTKV